MLDGCVCVFDGVKIMEQGQMDMAILRVGSVTMVSRRGREDVTAVLVISWQADRQGKAGREKPGQAWVRR